MTETPAGSRSGVRADGALLALALAKLVLHATAITRYGWFRDELYYLVCAQHAAAGYVDQPPLSIWILGLVRTLLGDSLVAIRLLPALTGAATVFLTGRIARELGGGRFAQVLAALAALIAPVFLAIDHFYSMNTFDVLTWTIAAWLALKAMSAGSPRHWLLLGVVLGLGLLNKISVMWLIAGLSAGTLLSPARGALRTRWPWLAIGIALLLFAPYVAWQIQHGWPTLEFMRNATGRKMAGVSPIAFVTGQIIHMNPVTLPLWLGGLGWLLFSRTGGAGRPLAVMYLAVAAFLMAGGRSRASYLAPAYFSLFAAGAVAFERIAQNYGEAGAITVLGRRRGLPPALSGHNNFWLWGPGTRSGEVMIVVGGDLEDNQRVFRELTRAGTVRSKYSMPYEQDMPVYIGRGLKLPMRELWPIVKMYI